MKRQCAFRVLVRRVLVPLAHTQVLDDLEQEPLKQHEFQVSWALKVYCGLRVHRYRISGAT